MEKLSPASATGGSFTLTIVTSTVSEAAWPHASVTVSSNVNVAFAPTHGAAKVVRAAAGSAMSTAGPPICCHW